MDKKNSTFTTKKQIISLRKILRKAQLKEAEYIKINMDCTAIATIVDPNVLYEIPSNISIMENRDSSIFMKIKDYIKLVESCPGEIFYPTFHNERSVMFIDTSHGTFQFEYRDEKLFDSKRSMGEALLWKKDTCIYGTQIKRLKNFLSVDDIRPAMKHIFACNGEFVATNGHLLATEKDESICSKNTEFYIPNTIAELATKDSKYYVCVSDEAENIFVDITTDQESIRYKYSEYDIPSYPDYKKIFPKEFDLEFEISKTKLMQILKCCMEVHSHNQVDIIIEDQFLKFYTNNDHNKFISFTSESYLIKKNENTSRKFRFNLSLMLIILKSINEKTITIKKSKYAYIINDNSLLMGMLVTNY